jgi:hypothetical protein
MLVQVDFAIRKYNPFAPLIVGHYAWVSIGIISKAVIGDCKRNWKKF